MSIVTLTVDLAPFEVPARAFELQTENPTPAPVAPATGLTKRLESSHFPLSALDVDTLVMMCDAFTDGVFEAAGKIRPPK